MLAGDRPIKPDSLVDAMSFECPYCMDTIVRYDLRMHHFIWECFAYPDAKRRLYFDMLHRKKMNHS